MRDIGALLDWIATQPYLDAQRVIVRGTLRTELRRPYDVLARVIVAAHSDARARQRHTAVGGSYGGYMVLACMIHYGDRLLAGSEIVGISNFITFLENTQDYRRDLRRIVRVAAVAESV